MISLKKSLTMLEFWIQKVVYVSMDYSNKIRMSRIVVPVPESK